MKVKMNPIASCFLLVTSLGASLSMAQMAAKTSDNASNGAERISAAGQMNAVSPTNVDLHALRGQLDEFQTVLNRNIQQNFEMPFALLQDAKGIYLPGFGVVFHMELNLQPLRNIWLFDTRPYTAEELRKAKVAKLARIQQLKTQLSTLLLERGGSLSAMAPEQNIAIVVHLFNLPSESRDLPTQLEITINRRMLLDYQARRLTAEEFQKAGSFLEF